MAFQSQPATTLTLPASQKRVYDPGRLYPPEAPRGPKTSKVDLGKLQRAAILGDEEDERA